jgi:hypothetical protein
MARNLTTGLQRGLRRSIAGGLGASDLFSTAPLDLRFAQQKTLDPRVTFTRQSRATYVDGDGVIRTATTNLLLQSEDFSTTWTNTESSENINVAVAPNGTTTADALVDTVNNSSHNVNQSVAGCAGSTSYTFSCYMKKGSKDFGALVFSPNASWGTGSGATVFFDLTNGTISASTSATGTIQALPNGWYRCTATATTVASPGTVSLRVGSSLTGSAQTYEGNGDEAIYLWGAQLEQSTTVGEYIPTTSTINSAPRFDHDPTTGESLGLLMEESRQNLVTQSESFSTWTVSGQGTTQSTDVGIVAPDGSTGNVQLFTEDLTTGVHRIFISPYIEQTTKTHSVFAKAATGTRKIYLSSDGPTGTRQNITFDLQTGDIVDNSGDWSGVFITPYPNGWYRIGGTITDNGGSTLLLIGMNDNTTSYTGDGTSGFYLWGAQLEAGSKATSYIPTTTTAATRAADVASISGSNFSSWYRQDEGTVFAEAERPDASRSNTVAASITDGSGENRIEVRSSSTSNANARCEITALGLGQYSNATLASDTAYKKIALAYAADNVNSAANGNAGITDTVATIPVVSQLYIGNDIFLTDYRPGHVKRLTYWPQRLSNDTLQNITV